LPVPIQPSNILLAAQGYTTPRIAPLILRGDDIVQEVLKRFRAGGLNAVPRRYVSGRARTVTAAGEAALRRVIARDPHNEQNIYRGAFGLPWSIGFLARDVGLNQARGYPPRLSHADATGVAADARECSRRGDSSRNKCRFVSQPGFPGQAYGFGDSLFTDGAAPIVDDNLPGRAIGDLLQDIGDEYACPHECGLSVTDRRVGDDVSSKCFRHPATSLTCFSQF